MPRVARARSESGIYHVVVRGTDRQDIFRDRKDRVHYLYLLADIKGETGYILHGYCLMSNHVHLLLDEGENSIGVIMHRLNTSYARWFNNRYQRCGHLFQNRFKSEPVMDDGYFVTVLRYIHLNPVKAGLVSRPERYLWSSYRAYYAGVELLQGLVATSFSLDLMGGRDKLVAFTNHPNDDSCLDLAMPRWVADQAILDQLAGCLRGTGQQSLHQLERGQRDQVLRRLKAIEGASIRQIARLTGLGKKIVQQA
ncbi:MAG: transposase [Bacillota bacterium]